MRLLLLALATSSLSALPHNVSFEFLKTIETKTCGEILSANAPETYFVNPGFPGFDNATKVPCKATIEVRTSKTSETSQTTTLAPSPPVCQLRLDFLMFNIAQPGIFSGKCDKDFLRITGTKDDDSLPQLCGENARQHLYADVDSTTNNVVMQIITDGSSDTIRREWMIKVTRIPCGSDKQAPSGCRQYYESSTGTVRSFNFKNPYPPPYSAAQINEGISLNLHLANQDYRVCIKEQPDISCISWKTTDDRSFAMTGNFLGQAVALDTVNGWRNAYTGAQAGGAVDPTTDVPCADYVQISGGSYAGIGSLPPGQADRYCGGTFTVVTSRDAPFGLHVITDGKEPTTAPGMDTANIGFSLDYKLLYSGCETQ